MSKGITSQNEDYSQWYNDIVIKADLAEHSAVRGCMVIKPYGYSIWERMQAEGLMQGVTLPASFTDSYGRLRQWLRDPAKAAAIETRTQARRLHRARPRGGPRKGDPWRAFEPFSSTSTEPFSTATTHMRMRGSMRYAVTASTCRSIS